MKRAIIVVALLIICGVITLFFYKGADVTVLETKSPAGVSAIIYGYRDGLILGMWSADLMVRSKDGQIILRTNLLRGRDALEDIRIEFLSLEFRGDAVHLDARGVHYQGTNEFRFHN